MYSNTDSRQFILDEDELFRIFPRRSADAYKGSFGKVLLISGSYGMAGAASLNILGAKALGAGYILSVVPEDIYPIVASRNITPVFVPLKAGSMAGQISGLLSAETPSAGDIRAASFGSGVNNNPEKHEIFSALLSECTAPLVLDADALVMLSELIKSVSGNEAEPVLLSNLDRPALQTLRSGRAKDAPVIITPHIGEFIRLTGMDKAAVQKDTLSAALSCAKALGAVTVLKGSRTVVASPDGRYYVNNTGNQGLAQAGSGDVLTGMAAAMLSYAADPFEAACMAVFAHGLAADELCSSHSHQCMPLESIPSAIDALFYKHGF